MNPPLAVSEKIIDRNINLMKSAALFLCFFADGMSNAIVGPTLLDLQTQTATSVKEISLILPSRSIGQGVGALACEYKKYTRNEEYVF